MIVLDRKFHKTYDEGHLVTLYKFKNKISIVIYFVDGSFTQNSMGSLYLKGIIYVTTEFYVTYGLITFLLM